MHSSMKDNQMKTYTKIMFWLMLGFSIISAIAMQSCAGWKEVNTRDKQETEWQPGVEEINAMENPTIAEDVTDQDIYFEYLDELNPDVTDHDSSQVIRWISGPGIEEIASISGLDLQYLESLVNRISEYEDMKKKRSLRADDIAKIGKQKSLHDQVLLEIELCVLKISNTKQLYNAASVMIDSAILDAAGLPKYFESEKEF